MKIPGHVISFRDQIRNFSRLLNRVIYIKNIKYIKQIRTYMLQKHRLKAYKIIKQIHKEPVISGG